MKRWRLRGCCMVRSAGREVTRGVLTDRSSEFKGSRRKLYRADPCKERQDEAFLCLCQGGKRLGHPRDERLSGSPVPELLIPQQLGRVWHPLFPARATSQ